MRGPATGAASVGAAPVGPPGGAAGSASVGAASVAMPGAATGAAKVGSAPVGAAKVGAARVGAAAPPPGARPALPARAAVDAGAGAEGVPRLGEERGGNDEEAPAGLRGQLRSQRKLRVVTLVSLAVVVLVVLPAFFGLRAAGNDPVFSSLNSLEVPSWAEQKVDDQSSGSRWCFFDCTFRERTAESEKPFKETTAAYTSALTAAGWEPWKVVDCPEFETDKQKGTYTCFKRDEFTLDLVVGPPPCEVDQVAANDPSVGGATAPPVKPAGECVGSSVSIKVQTAIADTRGQPQEEENPLVGVTPDPVITDDPLLEPTPSPS